jgi:hypothetical protein
MAKPIGNQEGDNRAEDGATLKGRHDTTGQAVIWVLEIFQEYWLGDGGGNDTGIITKEETCMTSDFCI